MSQQPATVQPHEYLFIPKKTKKNVVFFARYQWQKFLLPFLTWQFYLLVSIFSGLQMSTCVIKTFETANKSMLSAKINIIILHH